jgi:hypothetical protein
MMDASMKSEGWRVTSATLRLGGEDDSADPDPWYPHTFESNFGFLVLPRFEG